MNLASQSWVSWSHPPSTHTPHMLADLCASAACNPIGNRLCGVAVTGRYTTGEANHVVINADNRFLILHTRDMSSHTKLHPVHHSVY